MTRDPVWEDCLAHVRDVCHQERNTVTKDGTEDSEEAKEEDGPLQNECV